MSRSKLIPYTRDLLILANSKKNGGHCIAGKDIKSGKWVRVVPHNECKAINSLAMKGYYGDFNGPQLLDIVRIIFSEKDSENFHPENEYINENTRWIKINSFTDVEEIDRFVDNDDYDWFHKINMAYPKIPASYFVTNKLKSSLRMIKLDESNGASVYYEQKYNSTNYRPTLRFTYKGYMYNLKITDPAFPQSIKEKIVTEKLKNAYIIIGLGESYLGSHYKLVVGIIKII